MYLQKGRRRDHCDPVAMALTARLEQQRDHEDRIGRVGRQHRELLAHPGEDARVQDAFKLAWKNDLPAQPVQADNAWCVYEVKERRPGSGEADEQMSRQLLAAAQRDLLTAWLGSLQAKARIQINQTLLK